jgi:hypothetical protein
VKPGAQQGAGGVAPACRALAEVAIGQTASDGDAGFLRRGRQPVGRGPETAHPRRHAHAPCQRPGSDGRHQASRSDDTQADADGCGGRLCRRCEADPGTGRRARASRRRRVHESTWRTRRDDTGAGRAPAGASGHQPVPHAVSRDPDPAAAVRPQHPSSMRMRTSPSGSAAWATAAWSRRGSARCASWR